MGVPIVVLVTYSDSRKLHRVSVEDTNIHISVVVKVDFSPGGHLDCEQDDDC